LLKLLAESDYVTTGGRPNLASFARELNGIHYETLRRAVRGEAPVSLRLLEETARVLRLNSDYFRETPLLQAVQAMDTRRPIELTISEREEELPPVSDEAVDALNRLAPWALKTN
jgi:hypothetical protein